MNEIFVTYSWDHEDHCNKVISFTNFLRQKGFQAEMDRMFIQKETSIDFKKMMHKAMTDYEKVIVVLSLGYKQKAEKFQGGVGAEYNLILKDIEDNPKKYILVSFEGVKDDITPLFFKGREITDLSDESKMEELFAKLQDLELYEFFPVAPTKPNVKKRLINNFNSKINKVGIDLSLKEFCEIIKADKNTNPLKILNLPLSNFEKATQDLLNANPTDIQNGIKDVYFINSIKIFDTFVSCVHKIYTNGDKQYFFYTTTKDVASILSIANNLYNCLGTGLYDDRRNHSFRDTQQISDLSNGYLTSERDECHTMWRINDYSIHLRYCVKPLNQLILLVERKNEIIQNFPRNDSIINYLHYDISDLISTSIEVHREMEGGIIKFIDYVVNLPKPFINIFTKAKFRIFSKEKIFNTDNQIHLFLYSRNNIVNIEDIRASTKFITSIYGKDNFNSCELQDYEIADFNEFNDWVVGRSYSFDSDHKLLTREKNQSSLYDIRLNYNEYDGLVITIIAFNELVKYEGISIDSKIENSIEKVRYSLKMEKRVKKELINYDFIKDTRTIKLDPSLKFISSKVYIHSIDKDTYPKIIEGQINSWFITLFYDTYHKGIEFWLDHAIGVDVIIDKNGNWEPIHDYSDKRKENPKYKVHRAKVIGRINYCSIVDFKADGDEYSLEPHLYCVFNKSESPFEEIYYRLYGNIKDGIPDMDLDKGKRTNFPID